MSAEVKYYSGKKALSFGTPFIFTLGNRSIGKTFYWTKRCINMFLQGNHKFLYVRRYADDLKKVADKFWDNVLYQYEGVKFDVDGKGANAQYFINSRQAGMAMALSGATKYKGISLADYDTIFFDEFLPEDGQYLPDEVGLALNLYQTVARGYGKVIRPEVRFIFVANNVTMMNPYFKELHILENIQVGAQYTKDPDGAWLVEFTHNASVADAISETAFGKMISKTKYGDYALKGSFYLDDPTFIQKPQGASTYYCTLVWEGKYYGVFEYKDDGFIYISKKYDKSCPEVFSLTTNDHKPNYMMLYKASFSPIYGFLRYAYENALVRFYDMDCKDMFMNFMKYTI